LNFYCAAPFLDCYYRPEQNWGALEMILAESYAPGKK
jgi:hypothetical protein